MLSHRYSHGDGDPYITHIDDSPRIRVEPDQKVKIIQENFAPMTIESFAKDPQHSATEGVTRKRTTQINITDMIGCMNKTNTSSYNASSNNQNEDNLNSDLKSPSANILSRC